MWYEQPESRTHLSFLESWPKIVVHICGHCHIFGFWRTSFHAFSWYIIFLKIPFFITMQVFLFLDFSHNLDVDLLLKGSLDGLISPFFFSLRSKCCWNLLIPNCLLIVNNYNDGAPYHFRESTIFNMVLLWTK